MVRVQPGEPQSSSKPVRNAKGARVERPSLYPGLYPVTPQQLFVHTIDDLDARLDLNRGEYDALMMAWLIRKLLHDGHFSRLSLASVELTTRIYPASRFTTSWRPLT